MKTPLYFFPLFFIFSISISSFLYSEDYEENTCLYPFEKSCYGIPSAQYPPSPDEVFMFLNGAYTLWRPYQDNMAIAVTNLVDPTSDDHPTKDWLLPHTNFVSGFKAGLGFNTFHDGWKISAEYTYFNHSPCTYRDHLNNPIYTYWVPYFTYVDNNYHYIDSRWTIFLQKIDLFLQRSFYAGKYLIFSPIIGMTGAWDKQTMQLLVIKQDSTEKTYYWDSYQNYWGVGPTAGIEADYYIYDRLGFFLLAKTSIVYSEYYSKVSITEISPDTKPNPETDNYVRYSSYKPTNIQALLESIIGIKIDLNGIDWGVQLFAGWEVQTWFNHNQTSRYIMPASDITAVNNKTYLPYQQQGNFYLHGLTCGLNLSF